MENIRFCFKYGENDIWNSAYKKTVEEIENSTVSKYIFEDGLTVTNIIKRYPEFNAYESVNYFENTGSKNTKIISELYDCNAEFVLGKGEKR